MRMLKSFSIAAMSAVMLTSAGIAGAAMTPEEADRLGKDLTPFGAIKAGNADGTIPEWTGGIATPPAGWEPKQGYPDPFASEKPIVIITAKNAEEYKDKLSPGLIALMQKYPNFSVPVYPSHRTFANPQAVYDATKAGATKTSLSGLTINNYELPAVPFPNPKTGTEAMYNHLNRWTGGSSMCEDWLPVRGNGDYYRVGFCVDQFQAQAMDTSEPNYLFYFFGYYDAPATLKGTIYLVWDVIDKTVGERQAWIYNAGQRRVRRAPDLAYDNIDDGTEGMQGTDEYFAFNGALDRYDWKLVGTKEMYIPYNAYKLGDPSLKYKDMVGTGSLKSELFRYELHRVHVVEATLREGMSHMYARRTFYLDEDSGMVALADQYDSKGNLWRIQVDPLIQLWDAPRMYHRARIVHDLTNGNYIVEGLDNERPKPSIVSNLTGKRADFEVSAIRRRGIR